MSISLASVSVTNRGFLSRKSVEGRTLITWAEYGADEEIVLCALPACVHGDMTCFSYALARDGAQHFALWGEWLYYLVQLYEPEEAEPYVQELRRSRADGSVTETVARIARDDYFASCQNLWLRDNRLVLQFHLEQGEDYDPTRKSIRFWATISLVDGVFHLLPEHTGYSVGGTLLYMDRDVLVYSFPDHAEPVDYLNYHLDGVSIDELLKHSRVTVYKVDLSNMEVSPWQDEWQERSLWDGSNPIYLTGLTQGLLTSVYSQDGKHHFTLYPWDMQSPYSLDVSPTTQPVLHGELLFFSRWDWMLPVERWLYDMKTGISLDVSDTPLMGYTLAHAMPEDKLLLYKLDSDGVADESVLYWIAIEDVRKGQFEQIREVRLLGS